MKLTPLLQLREREQQEAARKAERAASRLSLKAAKQPPVDRYKQFANAVEEMYQCGLLVHGLAGSRPEQVGPGEFVCIAPQGFAAVARELASSLGGQVSPSRYNDGLSWQSGQTVWGHLIHPRNIKSVLQAQGTVNRLIPNAPLKWTVGANARLLLGYIGPPQTEGFRTKNGERLLEGIEYGYHECTPGLYPQAEHWDVSEYYYTMMTRLPSLYLTVTPNDLIWHDMADHERGRWQEVIAVCRTNKNLRNAMAGVMAGSTAKMADGTPNLHWYYCRDKDAPHEPGEPFPVKLQSKWGAPGPFRPAGLLLVRTGYEKTLEQCRQNDTIYSIIDSVIVTSSRTPVWESYGFSVERKSAGDAHIICRGNYRVGPTPRGRTKNYLDGQGTPTEAPRPPRDPFPLYGTWL